MQAILAKYPENKSDYLLPIIKAPDTNERSVYRNVSYSINQRLVDDKNFFVSYKIDF